MRTSCGSWALGIALVALLGGVAAADLCPKCKGQMYTQDVGKCKACGGDTASGAFALCKACSAKLKQCEHCRAPLKGDDSLVLDKESNGKTVAAQVGQQIVIKLRGNPTTGYQWSVAKLEGESVEAVGEPKYEMDPGAEGRVGAGGTYTFTFKAVKAGQAALSLRYARSWEKKKPPAETFALTVEVTEPAKK
jgi:inhibitor of cysteine peptidase